MRRLTSLLAGKVFRSFVIDEITIMIRTDRGKQSIAFRGTHEEIFTKFFAWCLTNTPEAFMGAKKEYIGEQQELFH